MSNDDIRRLAQSMQCDPYVRDSIKKTVMDIERENEKRERLKACSENLSPTARTVMYLILVFSYIFGILFGWC